jgi:hypothetical protein
MRGRLAGAAARPPRHLVGKDEGWFEEIVDGMAQICAG